MGNYPEGHKAAAVIPALDLAQRQHGMTNCAVEIKTHNWPVYAPSIFLVRLASTFCNA
jgi:hypothetical protein